MITFNNKLPTIKITYCGTCKMKREKFVFEGYNQVSNSYKRVRKLICPFCSPQKLIKIKRDADYKKWQKDIGVLFLHIGYFEESRRSIFGQMAEEIGNKTRYTTSLIYIPKDKIFFPMNNLYSYHSDYNNTLHSNIQTYHDSGGVNGRYNIITLKDFVKKYGKRLLKNKEYEPYIIPEIFGGSEE